MALTRRLQSNFSKGELSPQIEGRPDLAAFFAGASTLENFWLFYEGGAFRRYGTRYVAETKDSSKQSILIPFKFNIEQAYFIEAGENYFRFYRRGLSGDNRLQRIESSPGVPVEVVTPYLASELADLQWSESADVLYIVHGNHQQQKLSRLSDTSWFINPHIAHPPPSYEAPTVLGGSIAFGANTGSGVQFRAENDVFLAADVGRVIADRNSLGQATIVSVTSGRGGTVDITDAFSQAIAAGVNTLTSVATAVAITAHGLSVGHYVRLTSGAQSGEIRLVVGVVDVDNVTIDFAFSVDQAGVTWERITGLASSGWHLTGSPQTTLDPDKKEPIHAKITLVAGAAAFRTTDVGKYIKIYEGVVRIIAYTSGTQVTGEILSILSGATAANPPAAPSLSWTLEVASWSDTEGWPQVVEFHQGRLSYGATRAQPTTWWESASDSFDNFAIGANPADAVEYTIANRSVNVLEWMVSLKHLFLGDAENEHNARGPGTDEPLGGDVIPYVSNEGDEGALSTMALVAQRAIIFIQRFARKLAAISYDVQDDAFTGTNLTAHARHISGADGFKQHPPIYAKEPNYQIHFPREDGQIATLTLLRKEQVSGWTRFVTDGEVEALGAIPDKFHKQADVAMIVNRTINGQTKRYIESVITPDDKSTNLVNRLWREYYTDCGADGTILAGATTISGASHLEAKTVDVVIGDSYRQTAVVTGGVITLNEAVESDTVYEYGLPYTSTLRTMRPAIQGAVIDGLVRGWKKICLLLHNSIGGKINGRYISYPPAPLSANALRNGPFVVPDTGSDLNGYITVVQDQPYPFQLLSLSGTLYIGDDQ